MAAEPNSKKPKKGIPSPSSDIVVHWEEHLVRFPPGSFSLWLKVEGVKINSMPALKIVEIYQRCPVEKEKVKVGDVMESISYTKPLPKGTDVATFSTQDHIATTHIKQASDLLLTATDEVRDVQIKRPITIDTFPEIKELSGKINQFKQENGRWPSLGKAANSEEKALANRMLKRRSKYKMDNQKMDKQKARSNWKARSNSMRLVVNRFKEYFRWIWEDFSKGPKGTTKKLIQVEGHETAQKIILDLQRQNNELRHQLEIAKSAAPNTKHPLPTPPPPQRCPQPSPDEDNKEIGFVTEQQVHDQISHRLQPGQYKKRRVAEMKGEEQITAEPAAAMGASDKFRQQQNALVEASAIVKTAAEQRSNSSNNDMAFVESIQQAQQQEGKKCALM